MAIESEDKLVERLSKRAAGQRHRDLHFPLPKGMLIDSGNGPESHRPPRLGPLSEGDREVYCRAWQRLSPEDRATLTDSYRACARGLAGGVSRLERVCGFRCPRSTKMKMLRMSRARLTTSSLWDAVVLC